MAPSSRPPGFEPLIFVVLTLVALVARGAVPLAEHAARGSDRVLRVAADPDHLPYTNDRQEGFENRIAELIAHDLHARIEYVWQSPRPGFLGESRGGDGCDVVLGVTAGAEHLLTTRPYYRATYAFVTRQDRRLDVRSLDDPRLRYMKIGVPFAAGGRADSPPIEALARRGIVRQVERFTVDGNRPSRPPARILQAVAEGEIDVAIVWGPAASFLADREAAALEVTPVLTATGEPLELSHAISVGVRADQPALRDEIESILLRRRADIDGILDAYGVPRLAPVAVAAANGRSTARGF